MSDTALAERRPPSPEPTRIRRLRPEETRVFPGHAQLHCEVEGEPLYRGVFAVLLFPVSNPSRFVSLRYTDTEDKIQEIGVIENLEDFPEEHQQLVRQTLGKQYHQQTIYRIFNVKCEYGWLLTFDVQTDRGREEFMMRWRQDRADAYGPKGKVLLDVHENRFIIPDTAALPTKDRRRLLSYIYW